MAALGFGWGWMQRKFSAAMQASAWKVISFFGLWFC